MQVVLASGNRGKLEEFRQLLANTGLDIVPQHEFGIEPAPETATTFIENALGKARHAADTAQLPAIADDSGLVVPALDGAPGIRSARYAGEGATDAQNRRKLLDACRGLSNPKAYFYCALVFVLSARDPAPLVATAAWHGAIASTESGNNGFGYDPVFLVGDTGATAAQLDPAQKSLVSHRGQASRALCDQIRTRFR